MTLSFTGRRWVWPTQASDADLQAREPRLPPWITLLLQRRGIVGTTAVERYLEPSLGMLDEPLAMADMEAAVDRLRRAVLARESIVIYGDYDVDGVCSTATLVDFLRQAGADVTYYIPDRRAEGYGLNEAAVATLAPRCRVLITTDCGITAHREIELARRLGADVIVVDHHQVPAELPPALACLNPHRPDCRYPFKGLCAAGVAFMLTAALRRGLRDAGAFRQTAEPDIRDLLDLVALATVADMVPMLYTNRILVAAGLRRMARGARPGLQALCAAAKVDPSRVSVSDVGFRIAPRINARGRISHAAEAVELLLTHDPVRAQTLAAALDDANEGRRALEKDTVAAALAHVEANGMGDAPALVAYDPAWHPGVLGLVATRLVSRFHRPAIVIGEGGKGSGRSVEGLDLCAAIATASSHLVRYGGHPAAAGVTIEPESVEAFRSAFGAEVLRQLGPPPYAPVLRPDLEVDVTKVSLEMVSALEKLAPFGQGNPEPLLVARGLAVRHKRVVGGTHLKLMLGAPGHDAIGFGLGELLGRVPEHVDAAFHLERNSYQGRESVQLRLTDLRPAEGRAC